MKNLRYLCVCLNVCVIFYLSDLLFRGSQAQILSCSQVSLSYVAKIFSGDVAMHILNKSNVYVHNQPLWLQQKIFSNYTLKPASFNLLVKENFNY